MLLGARVCNLCQLWHSHLEEDSVPHPGALLVKTGHVIKEPSRETRINGPSPL
jgi:hypothetical protein